MDFERSYSPLPILSLSDEVKAIGIKPEPLDLDGPLDFPVSDHILSAKCEGKSQLLQVKDEEPPEKLSFRFAYQFTDHYESLTKRNVEAETHLVWKKKQLTFQTGVLLFVRERSIQVTKILQVEVFDPEGKVIYSQNENTITYRVKRDPSEWTSALTICLVALLEKNPEPTLLQFSLSLPNIARTRSEGKLCLGFPPPSSWIRSASLFSHLPYFCFEKDQFDALHEDQHLCFDKISTGIYFTLQLDCPNSRGEYFDLTLSSENGGMEPIHNLLVHHKMRVRLLTKYSRKEPISVESLRSARNDEAASLIFSRQPWPQPSCSSTDCQTRAISSFSSRSPSFTPEFSCFSPMQALKSSPLEGDFPYLSDSLTFSPCENSPKRTSVFPPSFLSHMSSPTFCKPMICHESLNEIPSFCDETENKENAKDRIVSLEKTVKLLQRELLVRRMMSIHRGPSQCVGCMMKKHTKLRAVNRRKKS